MKTNKLFMTIAVTASLLTTSCTDKFDDMENSLPSWLHENIYDYLKGRGDCNYYVRLIDDCGYTQSMKMTGSNTVFFSKDSTFDAFFASNEQGIKSYNDLSSTFKNMILRTGIISNAQLLERLSESDQGNIIFRRTTSLEPTDTVPLVSASSLPENSYFSAMRTEGGKVYMLQDNSFQTLVQFFPDVMDAKKIYNSDYKFITGRERTSTEASLFNNQIVKSDITCKNGYLHELKNMLSIPYNMEQYIRNTSELSTFGNLMTRFCEPVDTKYRTTNGDTIWTMRYFNNYSLGNSLTKDTKGNTVTNYLYYDPGWNLYTSETTTNGQAGFQKDMAVMFVPSDSAMTAYLSPTGDGADLYSSYPTWSSLPDNIAADYVKNHQLYSFLSSLPHNFSTLKDEAGYSMDLKESDIESTFIGRNGVVYVTKRVFPPLDYKSVMGPAKMNPLNSIFRMAMEDSYCQFQYYLRSLKSSYLLLITPNESMKGYVDPVSLGYNTNEQCYWDFYVDDNGAISAIPYSIATGQKIDKFTSSSNISTLATNGIISGTAVIKNRLQDILDTHTLVLSNGVSGFESAIDAGQEWFISKGYAPVHVGGYHKGSSVMATGNTTSKNVTTRYDKSNGLSFLVDGILQNTTKSVYDILSSNDNFSEFFNLCNEMGFFEASPTTTSHALDYRVKFFGQYHYTIYVPTNAAIEKAQEDGIIPTISEIESETDADKKSVMEETLKRFLRYHFQDEAVMDRGEALNSSTKLSATLNETTNQFYPLYITNTTAANHSGGRISIQDTKGNIATVSTDDNLHNLVARDIVVNASALTKATEIETYAYAVIHQIDKVLRFE
jgi:hypothetical protein